MHVFNCVVLLGEYNKESMYICMQYRWFAVFLFPTNFDLKLGDLQVEPEGMSEPLYIFAELLWRTDDTLVMDKMGNSYPNLHLEVLALYATTICPEKWHI